MKLYVVEMCLLCPNYKLKNVGPTQRLECYALIEEQTIKLLSQNEMDNQVIALREGDDVVFPEWCPLDDVH